MTASAPTKVKSAVALAACALAAHPLKSSNANAGAQIASTGDREFKKSWLEGQRGEAA